MTNNIAAAVKEYSYMQSEFRGCQRYLQEANEVYPVSDAERAQILLRMGCLKLGMDFLDKAIVNDLSATPMDFNDLIKPKDEV